MVATCNGCGDCCRAVILGFTKKQAKGIDSEDARWILNHLTRISRKEAARRVPGFKDALKGARFYDCDAFDRETNSCTAYEDRPRMCKDFPWYGRKPSEYNVRFFPDCSYREELVQIGG